MPRPWCEVQAAATAAATAAGFGFRPREYADSAYGAYGDQWYEQFGHQWPPGPGPEAEVAEPKRTSSKAPWVAPGPEVWPPVQCGEFARSLGAEAGRISLFNRRGVGALPVERRLPTMRSEVMLRRSDSGSVQSLYV